MTRPAAVRSRPLEGQERPRGIPRSVRKVDGRWFGDARINVAGIEIKLIYFGINDHLGRFSWPRETHPFHELFWTVSGRGWITSEGRTESCRAGHVFVSPAGVAHSSSWDTGRAAPWRGLILQFDMEVDRERLKTDRDLSPAWGVAPFSDYFLSRRQLAVLLDTRTGRDLKRSADDLVRHLKALPQYGSTLIAGFWLRFFAVVSQFLVETGRVANRGVLASPSHREAALRKAKRMLEEADRPTVDIGAVARAVGMSKYHFIRLFHEWFGVPPGRFSMQAAVAHAGRLLVQSDLPVSEIAARFGFADGSNFSKAFRRYAKIGPREFRRRGQRQGSLEPFVAAPDSGYDARGRGWYTGSVRPGESPEDQGAGR